MRGHLAHIDREVRIRHLLLDRPLQSSRAARRVKEEVILRRIIERSEERYTLEVVPVEVRDEDVRVKGFSGELLAELLAEVAESGSAIQYVDVTVDPHFDAGSVAAVAHVIELGSGRRTANTPE